MKKDHAPTLAPLRTLQRSCPTGRCAPTLATLLTLLTLLLAATAGCSMVSYTSPSGERFMRSSIGANTSISSLAVESDTNGVRRVQMHG